MAALHQRDCICHAGNELPRRESVFAHVEFMPRAGAEILGQPVCLIERQRKLVRWNPDPDMA